MKPVVLDRKTILRRAQPALPAIDAL